MVLLPDQIFEWFNTNMYQPLGITMASGYSVYSIMKTTLENINWSPFLYLDEKLDEEDFYQQLQKSYKCTILIALDAENERFNLQNFITRYFKYVFILMNFMDQKMKHKGVYQFFKRLLELMYQHSSMILWRVEQSSQYLKNMFVRQYQKMALAKNFAKFLY